jgi:hypothetical protein
MRRMVPPFVIAIPEAEDLFSIEATGCAASPISSGGWAAAGPKAVGRFSHVGGRPSIIPSSHRANNLLKWRANGDQYVTNLHFDASIARQFLLTVD